MYRHALMIAAYTNRTLVLYEPESDTSPFSCPASIDNTSSYPDYNVWCTIPSGSAGTAQCRALPYDGWMQRAEQSLTRRFHSSARIRETRFLYSTIWRASEKIFCHESIRDMHNRKQKRNGLSDLGLMRRDGVAFLQAEEGPLG
jgi:hypothetical protein